MSSEYTDSLNVTKDELNNKIDCIEVNQQIISNNIRDEISDKICSSEHNNLQKGGQKMDNKKTEKKY